MIHLRHGRRFLTSLAAAAWLVTSIQAAVCMPSSDTATRTLRCLEDSFVTPMGLQERVVGEAPWGGAYAWAESLFLLPGRSGTAMSGESRVVPAARVSRAEGYPPEIYRPPIPTG